MRDPEQPLVLVEATVEPVNLVAEPVEPLEERVELSVVEMLPLGHGP